MKDTLKSRILYILEKYPASRNDDVMLMLYLWREFYPSRIHRTDPDETFKNGRAFVYINDITELPREDHIKRHRAYIQNVQLKFPPTDPKVAEKRFKNIKKWQEKLYGK